MDGCIKEMKVRVWDLGARLNVRSGSIVTNEVYPRCVKLPMREAPSFGVQSNPS